MSIVVTMLQTRRGEDGTLWVKDQSYTASDTFGLQLISGNLATGATPLPRQSVQSLSRSQDSDLAYLALHAAALLALINVTIPAEPAPQQPPAPPPPPPAPPSLQISGSVPTSATVGTAYSGSVTATGGTAPYTYSVASGSLPAGLSLNSGTGAITGTPTTAGSSAGIVLRATDAAAATASLASVTIVVGAALQINGSVPTGATVGTAYSGSVTATGGTAPYTYSVASGSLPAGLSLNSSTGVITGTPTTAGSSAGIVLRATDAATATANLASITITVQPAALQISGSVPTSGTVGTAYSGSVTATGGTAPYTYSVASGSLPAGLSLNSSTGAITGTPTTAGSSAGIVLRATDAAAATANLPAVTITVAAAALDTRARFFTAPASAYTTNTAALLAAATPLTGSVNGSVAGSFGLTTTTGNYGWLAVLASASAAGVRVFDGVGYGGWSGAGLAGNNIGASPDPATSAVTFTDGNGVTWRLFRQDYINANPSASTYTVS